MRTGGILQLRARSEEQTVLQASPAQLRLLRQ